MPYVKLACFLYLKVSRRDIFKGLWATMWAHTEHMDFKNFVQASICPIWLSIWISGNCSLIFSQFWPIRASIQPHIYSYAWRLFKMLFRVEKRSFCLGTTFELPHQGGVRNMKIHDPNHIDGHKKPSSIQGSRLGRDSWSIIGFSSVFLIHTPRLEG